MASGIQIQKLLPTEVRSLQDETSVRWRSYFFWKGLEIRRDRAQSERNTCGDAKVDLCSGSEQSEFPFNEQTSFKRWMVSLVIGGVAVLALFALIPLVQLVDLGGKDSARIETVSMALPAPLMVESAHAEVKKTQQDSPTIELNPEIPKMDLQLLTLNMKPVVDHADMGSDHLFLDALSDELQSNDLVVGFDDLLNAPSTLQLPEIRYPEVLIRQKILEGTVVLDLLIDEEGRASCEGVVYASHPVLEALAKKIVNQTRFTVSKIDGEPVRVRGEWPLHLKAPGV